MGTRYALLSFGEESAYARDYDRRHTLLRAVAAGTVAPPPAGTALNLDPLSPPGPLFSAEVMHNQNHWINVSIKDAYRLPCDVRLAGKGVDPPR